MCDMNPGAEIRQLSLIASCTYIILLFITYKINNINFNNIVSNDPNKLQTPFFEFVFEY